MPNARLTAFVYRLIDSSTLLQRWLFCCLLLTVHLLLVPVYFRSAGLVAALGFSVISSWIWGMAISMPAGTLMSAALILPHYWILKPLGAFQTTVDLWQLVVAHLILPLVTYGLSSSFHLGRDLARQLQRTEEEQARFRGLFDANNDAVLIFDLNYRIVQANEQAANMLGYSREELLSKPYQELVAPEDHDSIDARIAQADRGGWMPTYERTYLHKDGHRVIVEINGGLVQDKYGKPLHYQAICRDITLRKAAEQELYDRATHDLLTGLYNRSMFQDMLERAIARAARNGNKMGILFFDLDRFKKVNDELGHTMGDLLLRTVAERVEKLLRYADTLFRFGGDEFTVILEHVEGRRGAEILAKKIELAIEEPFLLEGEYAYIGASVGIAIYPEDGSGADELINFADVEMYSVKNFKKLNSQPTP